MRISYRCGGIVCPENFSPPCKYIRQFCRTSLKFHLVIETFRIHKTEIIREPLLCGVDGKARNIDLNPICFKGCPIPKNQPHRTYDPASAEFSFYFTCNEHTFVYVMVQDGSESFKVFLAQVY